MQQLLASQVALSEDAEAVAATFGDALGGYFRLEISAQPDEQDKALELDGLYVEMNDQSFSAYDGTETVYASASFLEFVLNARGQDALGTRRVRIDFPNKRKDVSPFIVSMMKLAKTPFVVDTHA